MNIKDNAILKYRDIENGKIEFYRAKEVRLLGDISIYWVRHSFVTNSIRKGATMEFIQESLGHGNISTTQLYFAGFDDETKKEFANSLMDF